jgi:quinoprotein glucose dehydrogenase
MNKNHLFIFFVVSALFFSCSSDKKYDTWEIYNGSNEGVKYSTLSRIDTTNVHKLTVAWQYNTGDADTTNHSQIQCNPIIIDGILYATSPKLKLFAVDAASGDEKWVFDPVKWSASKRGGQAFTLNSCRGITYWADKTNKRIFFTAGSSLYSVDAVTGKPDENFGDKGTVDLHNGLGRDVKELYITSTSPGIIYENLIIMGSRVDEGPAAAPGHIRAYDVLTGKQKWIFHTIPYPGEEGYETWNDKEAYKHIGGANVWSGFSLDAERGILFAGTGSASFDFYGGKRTGANLFANSVLALDAATGKRIWHFQTVHHDLWDRDLPAPPVLVNLNKEGKKIPAVAQITKSGHVFLFERTTGKPVYPIVETPVPTEVEAIGEELSPTQPIPSLPLPFVRQAFTESEINHLLPDSSQKSIKKRLASYKNGNMFQPPSKEGTVFLPGTDGGAEWGGASFDPSTGILYVNANEMAWIITLVELDSRHTKKENYVQAGKRLYLNNCMSCHGENRKGSGNYPSLIDISNKYTQPDFYKLLATGRRMMPAFNHLSDEEQKAIASYIIGIPSIQNKDFERKPDATDGYKKLPYTITGYNKFLSNEGLPALRPPWGTLNAINLNTGELVWKTVLGNDPAFEGKGVQTGTENYGGSVVTAGGLLFIAATKDGYFRAFNKLSGKLLWETKLPAPAFATPSIYEKGGRQYIVIACGGGKLGTRSGDAFVAFALPQEK